MRIKNFLVLAYEYETVMIGERSPLLASILEKAQSAPKVSSYIHSGDKLSIRLRSSKYTAFEFKIGQGIKRLEFSIRIPRFVYEWLSSRIHHKVFQRTYHLEGEFTSYFLSKTRIKNIIYKDCCNQDGILKNLIEIEYTSIDNLNTASVMLQVAKLLGFDHIVDITDNVDLRLSKFSF